MRGDEPKILYTKQREKIQKKKKKRKKRESGFGGDRIH